MRNTLALLALALGACHGHEEDDAVALGCPAPELEGCTPDRSRGDLVCTLEHAGLERSFRLVVPDRAACAPVPLVFDLHGLTSNPVQEDWITGFAALGREKGFVVVEPAGSGEVASWNAGTCCGTAAQDGRDDVGFLDEVRARVEAAVEVDPARVYATGMSNGGYLAHRLACERADVLAAVAPVAGVLGVERCDSSRPMPVLHFHGTSDQLVPYRGGGLGGGLSAPGTAAWWAARDGCDDAPEVSYEDGDVRCEAWRGCAGGADVELCTVEGGGHTWPGGPDLILPSLGATTADVDATMRIWEFFEAHPLRAGEAWAPRTGPEVTEAPVGEACDTSALPPATESHAARLVMPDEEVPAGAGVGGAGTWSIEAAAVYLPPIAASQVLLDASEVLVSGSVALRDDGRFAMRLDVTGAIATSSYGILHVERHLDTTGAWALDGTDLTLTPDCGTPDLPAQATLTETTLSWLLSSGLIGDVRLALMLGDRI